MHAKPRYITLAVSLRASRVEIKVHDANFRAPAPDSQHAAIDTTADLDSPICSLRPKTTPGSDSLDAHGTPESQAGMEAAAWVQGQPEVRAHEGEGLRDRADVPWSPESYLSSPSLCAPEKGAGSSERAGGLQLGRAFSRYVVLLNTSNRRIHLIGMHIRESVCVTLARAHTQVDGAAEGTSVIDGCAEHGARSAYLSRGGPGAGFACSNFYVACVFCTRSHTQLGPS